MAALLDNYTHISFDLDGTLVHTVPEYRFDVVPRTIRELGGHVPQDEAIIDQFWFTSGRDEVIAEHFGIEPEVFWDHFHSIDDAKTRAEYTSPYDDVAPVLRALKKSGKTISLITDAPDFIADLEIAHLPPNMFDCYISNASHGFTQKPDPESMAHALKQISATPSETVYIGNSMGDAVFAKNAGVDFIFADRKEHASDAHLHARHHIHSLADLLA
ncbi:MAG: HAD family hydrolase [bacterium]|nr:HAD family hydrolase [bacterium]